MQILDSIFDAALAQETLTLAWCWLITRNDGVKLGFTSFDVPFVIDGVTYYGATGFTPSAIQTSADINKSDTQNLIGIADDTGITHRDLAAGLYEGAKIRTFLVDFTALPTSLELDPPQHLELPSGYIAEIKYSLII